MQGVLINAVFVARVLLLDAGPFDQSGKFLSEFEMKHGCQRPSVVPVIRVGPVNPTVPGRGVKAGKWELLGINGERSFRRGKYARPRPTKQQITIR